MSFYKYSGRFSKEDLPTLSKIPNPILTTLMAVVLFLGLIAVTPIDIMKASFEVIRCNVKSYVEVIRIKPISD